MGDIRTHAGITGFVRSQLEAGVPPDLLPAEHYTYLEIGNYLTDVSQFRDPPAHHRARGEIWSKAMAESIIPIFGPLFLLLFGVTGWVEDLFGEAEPESARHGALARFFEHMILAATHEGFSTEGVTARAAETAGAVGAAPPPIELLPPSEIDRVYRLYFTQYWPHEHLDFPPTRNLEEHREKRLFRPGRRGIIKYLEWDIQYLSEELTRLEFDWVRALNTNQPAERRADFMVRLGNLLHTVEDYWFHSNFAEMLHWGRARRRSPELDPATPEGAGALAARCLTLSGGPEGSTRLRRVLYRRLRYPVYDGDELSEEASDDGSELVFTGGFGKTDIFHTLGLALEGLEHGRSGLGAVRFAQSDLILMQLLFSQERRRQMVEGDLEEDFADAHEEQLMSGQVHSSIEVLRDAGRLSPRAAEEMLKAFDVDREVEDEYWLFPGVGGLLIHILGELERERMDSAAAQRLLDADQSSIAAFASDNGASAENVGTHSLISKDTPTSEPHRAAAIRLAKHASASVATRLLTRVATNRNIQQGLDWDRLLRFYLAYPRPGGARWWNELLGSLNGSQPDVSEVRSQPNLGLLGPGREPDKLRQRRNGEERGRLETYYRAFER